MAIIEIPSNCLLGLVDDVVNYKVKIQTHERLKKQNKTNKQKPRLFSITLTQSANFPGNLLRQATKPQNDT